MRHTLKDQVTALLLAAPTSMALASRDHANYERVNIDPRGQVSLQRDAQIFTNYCPSCHSTSGMCSNRPRDISLTKDEIKKNLIFITDKVGDVMLSAMNPKDVAKWFNAESPDLTLIAHSRGADYLYAYIRGFYEDPTRPNGWNSTVFDKVGIPRPLWGQQGIRAVELDTKDQPVMVKDEHGNLTPKLYWESTGLHSRHLPNGKVIEKEYDDYTHDLVNFLVYMGKPAQPERKHVEYTVIIFLLAVILLLAYFLKKEYWKDVH